MNREGLTSLNLYTPTCQKNRLTTKRHAVYPAVQGAIAPADSHDDAFSGDVPVGHDGAFCGRVCHVHDVYGHTYFSPPLSQYQ